MKIIHNWCGGEFLEASAVFVGTIIGVGIFGLPYIASKAGFGIMIVYFFVLTILVIVIHLLLAEVSRNTDKIARIPGYAEEYLGKGWGKFSLIVSSSGLIGALLAYIILGGKFLTWYFAPYFGGGELVYTLLYFAFGSYLIYKGIKGIAKTELIMVLTFMLVLLLFFSRGLPFLRLENLFTFDPHYLVLPYGAVLFSLWGLSLVPQVKEMTGGEKKKLRLIISSGIALTGIFYILFILIILGVSGPKTSLDAFSGFALTVGDKIAPLGFVFGILTTFTSFIALGLSLKKTFQYDLKMTEKASWFIACFSPLLLYFLGNKNFLEVISLTGAVMLGIEAIIVIFIYKKFFEKKFQKKAPLWIYPLASFFLIGLISYIFSPILFK
ncbi:MAG: aromatic amino acid transport family protein [Patescibacteria group bacterium]